MMISFVSFPLNVGVGCRVCCKELRACCFIHLLMRPDYWAVVKFTCYMPDARRPVGLLYAPVFCLNHRMNFVNLPLNPVNTEECERAASFASVTDVSNNQWQKLQRKRRKNTQKSKLQLTNQQHWIVGEKTWQKPRWMKQHTKSNVCSDRKLCVMGWYLTPPEFFFWHLILE